MTQYDSYIGKEFGSYRVISKIADGSYGSVYLAKHTILSERNVAVKVLHSFYLTASNERESFLQEAQLLEKLKHPNILPILDVGLYQGTVPYFVLEYASHGSLKDNIKRQGGRPFPLQEALNILKQVGDALEHAHRQNIIHRDLKPENILFDAQNRVLLADFGIATAITGTSKVDKIAGTPLYMAPEQFRGVASKEGDEYSLACIAYEMLTGSPPFEAADFVAMAYQHTHQQPRAPRQLNPTLPSYVEADLLKALRKERHERYNSISAFITGLQTPAQAPTPHVPPPPPEKQRYQQPVASVIPPPPPAQEQRPYYGTPPVQAQQPVYARPQPQRQVPVQQPVYNVPRTPYNPTYPAPTTTEPSGGDRLLALLDYLYPYLIILYVVGWLLPAGIVFFVGRKKPFLRFHFLQSQFLFVVFSLLFVISAIWYVNTNNGSVALSVAAIILLGYILLSLVLGIMALLGKRPQFLFFGWLAQQYADRYIHKS